MVQQSEDGGLSKGLSEILHAASKGGELRTPGNGGVPAASGAVAILAACKKVADELRSIGAGHERESEALAKQLEGIGDALKSGCYLAAEEVRNFKAIPTEHAEGVAKDLEGLGEAEAKRRASIIGALQGVRTSLDGIADYTGSPVPDSPASTG